MYQNVLLPFDLADKHCWRKALPIAVSLCEGHEARLHVMTVVPELGQSLVGHTMLASVETRTLEQAHSQLKSFVAAQVPPGIEVRRHVAQGRIYQRIIERAAEIEADLIVMAAVHPERERYLLGANADRVVRHAGCSVMIVRD